MTRLVIIAPILSGKTTLVHTWGPLVPVVETDAAEKGAATEIRDRLKALRHAAYESGSWDAYNGMWHQILREWIASQDPNAIVLAHSRHDAVAVGTPACYVLIPEAEFAWRRAELRDASRYGLAGANRTTVQKDLAAYPLDVFDAMEPALLYVVVLRDRLARAGL